MNQKKYILINLNQNFQNLKKKINQNHTFFNKTEYLLK